MKRTILATAIILSTASAQATDCNIELDGSLSYERGVLTVSSDKSATMTITPDYVLLIDGQAVDTTSSQQRAVENYYDSITEALPMTAEIAVEGIQLANIALTEVFGELIGYDDNTVIELNEALSGIADDVHTSFYANDGSIQINSERFDQHGIFDDQWEAELEQAIEGAVMASMGKLMIAIGTEMLFSGGYESAFEARMENFAADIEHRVESRAENLEFKAEQLCDVLHVADIAEDDLQREFKQLQHLNLLDISYSQHSM